MNINLPHVLAEVSAAFSAYERALADNDTFLLNALVWESPQTVRYRLDDMQHGSEKVREFHASRHSAGTRIIATCTTITTFGFDYATVNMEFVIDHAELHGRKTAVWARVGPDSQPEAGLHRGWRIVALHESAISRRETP
ncbi:AtzH-like domain-containing protein [Paraburkholderia solisilvae]|nr:AtzH-like domain-containing protein [Paraburkholderia solisilvae]